MSEYIPGTCNIGKGEIHRRQFVALIGFVLIIVSAYGLISQKSPQSARLGIFAPAMIFAVGWIQSRRKFCLAFGLMGTQDQAKLLVAPDREALNRRVKGPRFDDCKVAAVQYIQTFFRQIDHVSAAYRF